MATTVKTRKGSGQRRRYRGRMVLANGGPRAHTHGGHSQADAGWECGQHETFPTKLIPGKYKVSMKRNRARYTGEYGSIN